MSKVGQRIFAVQILWDWLSTLLDDQSDRLLRLRGNGVFAADVVGVDLAQTVLSQCFSACHGADPKERACEARLTRPHPRQSGAFSVEVRIKGRLVGFLSADEAAQFAVVCRDLRLRKLAILCQARIRKSPSTITAPVYRVALDLCWPRRSDLRASLDTVLGGCAAAHAKTLPL